MAVTKISDLATAVVTDLSEVHFAVDQTDLSATRSLTLADMQTLGPSAVVDTVADLATAAPRDGQLWQTRGYTTVGDGGANLYRYDVAASDAVDGGWVINGPSSVGRYIAVDRSVANVCQFGADRTGVADSHAAIQQAFDSSGARSSSISAGTLGTSINRHIAPVVFFPSGKFLLNDTITIDSGDDPVNVKGDQAFLVKGGSFASDYCIDIAVATASGMGNVSIEGIHIAGFPDGIKCGQSPNNHNLGQVRLSHVRLIGDGTGIGIYFYNRSTHCSISECHFEKWRHAVEIESCDVVDIKDSWFYCSFIEDTATRPAYDGFVVLRTGNLKIKDSIFTPAVTYNGTQPFGWIYTEDPASVVASHSVWCNVELRGNLFGGENGGLTTVIWAATPDDSAPTNVGRKCDVQHNLINNNKTAVGVGTFATVIALVEIPNIFNVTDNWYGSSKLVAASYVDGAVAPTPWLSTAAKPLFTYAARNAGGLSQGFVRGNDWIPTNLATRDLPDATNAPLVGYASNRNVLRFSNPSPQNINAFNSYEDGKVIRVFVDDNTTIIHSTTFIMLSGSVNYSPGANGAMMEFICMDGKWWEISRTAY